MQHLMTKAAFAARAGVSKPAVSKQCRERGKLFATLAPRDAYASGGGYRSGRDIKLDIWHRQHGLINRHIVGVEQLREAA